MEPAVQVFERSKKAKALDAVANVIGITIIVM